MNDNEKFGVELEAKTSAFKRAIANASSYVKKLSNELSQNSKMSVNPINTQTFENTISNYESLMSKFKRDISNVAFDKELGIIDSDQAVFQLESLKRELDAINNQFGKDKTLSLSINPTTLGILNSMGYELNEVGNNIISSKIKMDQLKKSTNVANNSVNTLSINSSKMSKSIDSGFKRGLKSAGKFALSLVSIRTIWALVSNSARSYMAQNEQLNASAQITTNAFGQMLAPAIKKVVDIGQYGVIILSKLVDFLFGTNTASRLTSKNLSSVTKSAKDLNKALSSIDEITNLDSSITSGIEADLAALDNFYEKMEEVTNWFEKWSQSSFLQALKSTVDWFKELDSWVQILLVSAPLLIGMLTGISSGLWGIALIEFTVLASQIETLIAKMKELKQSTLDYIATEELLRGKNDEVINTYNNLKASGENVSEMLEFMIGSYGRATDSLLANTNEVKENNNIWHIIVGTYSDSVKKQEETIETIHQQSQALYDLWQKGEMTQEQTEMFTQALKNNIDKIAEANQYLSKNSDEYKKNEDRIKSLQTNLYNVSKEDYRTSLTIDTDVSTAKAEKTYSNFFSNLGNKISGLFDGVFSWIGGKLNIGSYDVGTNYLKNDGLIYAHKGEAVIPAKYNNDAGYMPPSNNSEEIALLQQIAYGLANMPEPILNVNGKDLARITYNDYKREEARINDSGIIKVAE